MSSASALEEILGVICYELIRCEDTVAGKTAVAVLRQPQYTDSVGIGKGRASNGPLPWRVDET